MKLLAFLKREYRTKSASVAKDRLHIVIAQQRGMPDYMAKLEQEIIETIRRYVHVDEDAIQISLGSEGNYSALEVNVTLPSH